MKTREVYIEKALSLSDTGAKTVDIRTGAPISAIELIFGGTKGATENQSDKLQDHISKIEMVDGADVLWSLSMQEAVALNCYENGVRPYADLDLGAGGTPEESCFLMFGFYLNDPKHYLDVNNYRNLQLKITTALTAAAGTYTTGSLVVDVIAHIIEEGAGAYEGFLMAKEHYSWTTAASGDETIDMPRDFPYRMILVKDLETLITPQTNITDLKLTCDADRFIVFDTTTADMIQRIYSRFGEFQELIKSNMQDDDVVLSTFFQIMGASTIGGTNLFAYCLTGTTAEQIALGAYGQT